MDLTKEQVLVGIGDGTIHPNSPAVAMVGLSPQEISWAMPQPRIFYGEPPAYLAEVDDGVDLRPAKRDLGQPMFTTE